MNYEEACEKCNNLKPIAGCFTTVKEASEGHFYATYMFHRSMSEGRDACELGAGCKSCFKDEDIISLDELLDRELLLLEETKKVTT